MSVHDVVVDPIHLYRRNGKHVPYINLNRGTSQLIGALEEDRGRRSAVNRRHRTKSSPRYHVTSLLR